MTEDVTALERGVRDESAKVTRIDFQHDLEARSERSLITNDDDADLVAEERALQDRLHHLRQEHADLDASIVAVEALPAADQLLIARLKRKKLALRDEITVLENRILPDIIA